MVSQRTRLRGLDTQQAAEDLSTREEEEKKKKGRVPVRFSWDRRDGRWDSLTEDDTQGPKTEAKLMLETKS